MGEAAADWADLAGDGGVRVTILKDASGGTAVAPGDTVVVRYSGKLPESSEPFDAAAEFKFVAGGGEVHSRPRLV